MVEYLYKTAKGVLFLSKDKIPQNAEENESFMYKLASFIVDKRNLFFLVFISKLFQENRFLFCYIKFLLMRELLLTVKTG